VVGSMKWDSATDGGGDSARCSALVQALGLDPARPILVGASTAPGEDALLRSACPEGVQLVCAPRRPEWWPEAARVLHPCNRRSDHAAGDHRDRFLLDSIGELGTLYAAADVVVVGRSFGTLHGSDPIEPLARGAAVVIGPACSDFSTVVHALRDGGGLRQCDAGELSGVLAELFASEDLRKSLVEAGHRVIAAQQGATRRNAAVLLGAPG